MSLDTHALHNEIFQVFRDKAPGISYENLTQRIAVTFQGSRSWWKILTHAIGST